MRRRYAVAGPSPKRLSANTRQPARCHLPTDLFGLRRITLHPKHNAVGVQGIRNGVPFRRNSGFHATSTVTSSGARPAARALGSAAVRCPDAEEVHVRPASRLRRNNSGRPGS
ncbi:hypothetical protein H7I76_21505 [Mycolicibacterium vaccae]|uniref:Uncharacterized protein n=1 Tax=Mycolicibacterium vaccae ATCC 25954 TaxID=1194972 RepID=K0UWT3_MYCVA|nr:hypothetical protein MYVA_0454 [Mycolicibacterium vaccae 95051]EJZ09460.1 hypothetical protein MVAC_12341 [Mycolicibacterium vaccae ATCC 25954]MCV7062302.1 hypothetical protein [Mycolicibacterium vaccae]